MIMATIPDITVDSTEYVSVNTLTGIAVGTAMSILNKTTNWTRVQEIVAKPADTDTAGVLISSMSESYARADVALGSSEIWVRVAEEGRVATLSVQEI
jgi:hypothetical protein